MLCRESNPLCGSYRGAQIPWAWGARPGPASGRVPLFCWGIVLTDLCLTSSLTELSGARTWTGPDLSVAAVGCPVLMQLAGCGVVASRLTAVGPE